MPPPSTPSGTGAPGFIARFAVGYIALAALYEQVPNALLRETIFHYGLALPASWVIGLLAPEGDVHAVANVIASPYVTLEIVRGCEGAGLFFLLTAAMIARWRGAAAALVGLAAGLALVYVLNLARLVVLYFLAAHHRTWFELAHVYIAPVAVIAIVAAYFWWWTAPSRPHAGDAPA